MVANSIKQYYSFKSIEITGSIYRSIIGNVYITIKLVKLVNKKPSLFFFFLAKLIFPKTVICILCRESVRMYIYIVVENRYRQDLRELLSYIYIYIYIQLCVLAAPSILLNE